MILRECDACGKLRPCVNEQPIKAAGGMDTHACHECKQIAECDECEAYGRPITPEQCEKCGEYYDATDLHDVLTCPMSWTGPDEYSRWCVDCCEYPPDDGDRKLDAIREGDRPRRGAGVAWS